MYSISVIISTYSISRASYVLDCIRSVKNQSLLPDEILVVLDPNESLINYYDSILPKDVRIIVSERSTLSNARNAGIKNAIGEIICFIDDDAIADKNWLNNLQKNYRNKNVIGVGGLIIPIWTHEKPEWFPEELYWIIGCSYKGLPTKKSYIRNPIGANMSFYKYIFNEVGFFNPHIGRTGNNALGDEETEFSMRIQTKYPKYKIIYDPSAIVYHKISTERLNLRYIIKRSFYEGLGKSIITSDNKDGSLYFENRYLIYLLKTSLPDKLINIHKEINIIKIVVIIISTISTFMGFIKGKITIKI